MDVLRTIHGHNKFLVLLLFVITWGVMLVTAARGRDYGKLQRALFGVTHGFMGLQVIAGGVLVFSMGLAGAPYRIEHLGIMLLAFGLMHVPFRWKAETGSARARKTALVMAGVLALVVVGILRLPFPFFPVPKGTASSAPVSAAP